MSFCLPCVHIFSYVLYSLLSSVAFRRSRSLGLWSTTYRERSLLRPYNTGIEPQHRGESERRETCSKDRCAPPPEALVQAPLWLKLRGGSFPVFPLAPRCFLTQTVSNGSKICQHVFVLVDTRSQERVPRLVTHEFRLRQVVPDAREQVVHHHKSTSSLPRG